MTHPAASPALRFRSVFISDTHLGTRGARTQALADFLESVSCEHLFLAGDIVDGWRLRKAWFWDAGHDRVLRAVLDHAQAGTQVVYIPGNHDDMVRAWLPPSPQTMHVAGIALQREAVHVTASGLRLLVIHGDEFDGVVRHAKLLALVGDAAYTAALELNRGLNAVGRLLGLPYWSLSQWLKHQVKRATKTVVKFEGTMAADARRRGFDGIVCGHIHHAEMRMVDGMLYCNAGDWVESCTALVEHMDGRLDVLDWAATLKRSAYSLPPVPVPA